MFHAQGHLEHDPVMMIPHGPQAMLQSHQMAAAAANLAAGGGTPDTAVGAAGNP